MTLKVTTSTYLVRREANLSVPWEAVEFVLKDALIDLIGGHLLLRKGANVIVELAKPSSLRGESGGDGESRAEERQ